MPLSDSFPEDFRKEFAARNLKIGSVIRVFMKDTKPPKEKRFIIVGQSSDQLMFASIFINSEINIKIFASQELKDLHLELTAADRDYLDHDSYADCSNLKKQDAAGLLKIINDDPSRILGNVSETDLREIKVRIKSARTISHSIKKQFGLFL